MRDSTAAREKPFAPQTAPPAGPVLRIIHMTEATSEEGPEKRSDPSGLVDPIEVAAEAHTAQSLSLRDFVRGLVLFVVVGGTSFAMWSALVRVVAAIVIHLQAR